MSVGIFGRTKLPNYEDYLNDDLRIDFAICTSSLHKGLHNVYNLSVLNKINFFINIFPLYHFQ